MMRKLVLSSSSPARRALLERLKIPFEYTSPDIDESPLPQEEVTAMVLRLAEQKAKKSALLYPDALIIGADQVGTLEGKVFSKPLTYENAVAQLQHVSGKMVRFFTGLCLYDALTGQCQLAVETYDVYFRELTDDMINGYLQKEMPLNCAGSFHAEGLGIMLIKKFHGDDYTALIGLPLIQLSRMLENSAITLHN